MKKINKGNICLRCGDGLKYRNDEYGVILAHLTKIKSNLQLVCEDERTDYLISTLMKKTNGNVDLITEYVVHKMNRCIPKERRCPKCGNTLKTWRAKLCLECGAEFESLYSSK